MLVRGKGNQESPSPSTVTYWHPKSQAHVLSRRAGAPWGVKAPFLSGRPMFAPDPPHGKPTGDNVVRFSGGAANLRLAYALALMPSAQSQVSSRTHGVYFGGEGRGEGPDGPGVWDEQVGEGRGSLR